MMKAVLSKITPELQETVKISIMEEYEK
jgi:hypothetical protein